MSYNKMMKWNKKRPKGGAIQPVLFHTNSGFTPSVAFMERYFEYKEECIKNNLIPLTAREYYNEITK